MFKKILIANRGEIACRVIRTARKMGIRTVAVYSDADRRALHVSLADEAFRLGPPAAAESYLDIPAIIAACKASGAEAVHPGYGFLSENPDFVEAVEAAGLVFIGPSAASIRAMGLKDAAKALMEKSGVPVVPGYHGSEQGPAFLEARAGEIGYPVLIKARAGGGGKGMRRVERAEDFGAALDGARREAQSSFGDGHVLIEKYMAKPRHIEIQVFGDRYGNMAHLFERDCSLQRRHQKVIEEAPAPGMTPELRAAMGEAAVRAAKAIGYCGAGTVEFIADASKGLHADRFFFMEMNTRLQVEHPVTEAITGLDLVEWQLRVASGEPLPKAQNELSMDGWAFEARVYAENPARDFLPSTGRLGLFDLPSGMARIECGVRSGDEITPFYDPMIAKVIVHGVSRAEALGKLEAALGECRIAGVVTNIGFLSRLCRVPEFASGDVDTGMIERADAALFDEAEPGTGTIALAALAMVDLLGPPPGQDPWGNLRGFRLWGPSWQSVFLDYQGRKLEIRFSAGPNRHFDIETEGSAFGLHVLEYEAGRVQIGLDDRLVTATIARNANSVAVFCGGRSHVFQLPATESAQAEASSGGDRIDAPMPGIVQLVAVEPGTRVAKGDALIIMEAMKMELVLSAPRDGLIETVSVMVGDQVQEGAFLLGLAAEEG